MAARGPGTVTRGTGTLSFDEIETLRLTRGADAATGSTGADSIDGSEGDDTLTGGAGDDTLEGRGRHGRGGLLGEPVGLRGDAERRGLHGDGPRRGRTA